ncbi:hypothetical protein Pyn_16961 [Prunus yedoensis var. nudiflora]|uniref:Uncharacterized protein n=1 Tax=Prunus yedoensis var. nudiflora TaxID=2094558 RepID=A0A314Y9B0_PRUYE|nr:hypothetical protein Pyn_16961 [Prunus yedoensis var. nudiflora]
MTVLREKGGSQPEYNDKGIVTFEVHRGEIYEYAKELGYHDQVVVPGIQNGKKVCISSDARLLEWCHLVPPSFEREIVIYVEHPTVINVDESPMAWRERGPSARNLTAEFEHEDESDKQSSYEGYKCGG